MTDREKHEASSHSPAPQETQEADLSRMLELLVMARASRAMTSAVELGVFDALAAGPRSAEQIAEAIGTDPANTAVLLESLEIAGLLRRSGADYENTTAGQRYLVTDAPESQASNFRYQERLAPAWGALPEIVRRGHPPQGLKDRLFDDPAFTDRYIRGMAAISQAPARELASRLDLTGARLAMDIGGGPGAYALALAERSEELRVRLMDLPPTLRVAEQWLSGSPARDRIELIAGDYYTDSYGDEEMDLILMSHITHDEPASNNRKMIEKAYEALRPGGRLVIHDFVREVDRTFAALFSLHLMVYTQNGRTYSADEYQQWMEAGGLRGVCRLSIRASRPVETWAIIGTKP